MNQRIGCGTSFQHFLYLFIAPRVKIGTHKSLVILSSLSHLKAEGWSCTVTSCCSRLRRFRILRSTWRFKHGRERLGWCQWSNLWHTLSNGLKRGSTGQKYWTVLNQAPFVSRFSFGSSWQSGLSLSGGAQRRCTRALRGVRWPEALELLEQLQGKGYRSNVAWFRSVQNGHLLRIFFPIWIRWVRCFFLGEIVWRSAADHFSMAPTGGHHPQCQHFGGREVQPMGFGHAFAGADGPGPILSGDVAFPTITTSR